MEVDTPKQKLDVRRDSLDLEDPRLKLQLEMKAEKISFGDLETDDPAEQKDEMGIEDSGLKTQTVPAGDALPVRENDGHQVPRTS